MPKASEKLETAAAAAETEKAEMALETDRSSVVNHFLWLNGIERDRFVDGLVQSKDPAVLRVFAEYFGRVEAAEEELSANLDAASYIREINLAGNLLTLRLGEMKIATDGQNVPGPRATSSNGQGEEMSVTDYLYSFRFDAERMSVELKNLLLPARSRTRKGSPA